MSATYPNVGVRVVSDLSSRIASIDARDSTVIGMTLPCPNMTLQDQLEFELDKPIRISTDDPLQVAKLSPGMAADAVEMIARAGIVADIVFTRVPYHADIEDQIGAIVGSASLKTGIWALLEAKTELALEPGLLICPGYDEQRLGGEANPVAVAMDTICSRIIDCLAIVNTPDTSREAAVQYAADFSASLNMLAMYPKARITLGGTKVTRPISPLVAAHIVKNDKRNGHPYKAFWNQQLQGLEGLSQRVSYRDGDTTHDANFLTLNGVGTIIENKMLWSPFNTASDPTTTGYHSIKRVRTRRSIEKAIPRAMRLYMAQDLGPHLVMMIFNSLDEACREREAEPINALIDHEIIWSRPLNPNNALRDGELKVRLQFEETPELVDLMIYSEPQPEAFDVLAERIAQAIEQAGNPRFTVVAA